MKVLFVNTLDRGGAANSCKRLHLGLLTEGVESKVLLKYKQNDWPSSIQFIPRQKKTGYLKKLRNKSIRLAKELKLYPNSIKLSFEQQFIKERASGLELFSFPNSGLDITESPLYKEADIVNLHWVANFIDFKTFFQKNTKPVVWTLHDMNPFTGGEHYLEEFYGIDNKGEPNNRIISNKEKEISELNIQLKKEALSKIENLHIAAPSKWIMEEAQKSEIFNTFPIHHIPYGLDSKVFKLMDKAFARSIFNIPKNKKMILFVADSIDNQRKGFIYLKKTIEKFNDRNDVVLCAIGGTANRLESNTTIINLGEIKDERLMAVAYNAADVFVIPSLMDNLPNTVLESLMCGTPVIGFPVGGIKEMISEGENGTLTRNISVSALVDEIRDFLDNPNTFSRKLIRDRAVELYNQKTQVDRYMELYGKILNT